MNYYYLSLQILLSILQVFHFTGLLTSYFPAKLIPNFLGEKQADHYVDFFSVLHESTDKACSTLNIFHPKINLYENNTSNFAFHFTGFE